MRNTFRSPLRAGASKVNITPKEFAGLTNLWQTPFAGVHDPIFLRALVVANDNTMAAIMAADLVEFGDTEDIRKQIEKSIGIPADHVFLSATHNHNAPRAGKATRGAKARPGGPATEKYTEFVYDHIIEALQEAKAALKPARVGVGKGTVDVNTNRDLYTPQGWILGTNPDGPSDKTLWIIKFETISGEPIAILMNYAVHSVAIGSENRLVTGDLAGAAERYIEEYYQDKVVALWTIGAAGDQNPKYLDWNSAMENRGNEGIGYAMMEVLGHMVGAEALRVASHIERMASEVRIEVEQKIIACPMRIPGQTKSDPMAQKVDSINILLGLLLINHMAITSVSGEVVTEIYRRLRKVSPFSNTIMMTMTNDRIGYIVNDAAYDLPLFEVKGTPLERGYAEGAIINGLLDMMDHSL
jgi:neutral ceramidase